jgi:hypothetical protein
MERARRFEVVSPPHGTVSEPTLIALVKSWRTMRWNTLSDFSAFLEKGKISTSVLDFESLQELARVCGYLKAPTEKKKQVPICSAGVTVDGQEIKALKISSSMGSSGFAPIPNPIASEIIGHCLSSRKLQEQIITSQKILEIMQKHDSRLDLREVIALTNAVLVDTAALFGLRREIAPERWHYRLKPITRGVPTPDEWGNRTISFRRRFDPNV